MWSSVNKIILFGVLFGSTRMLVGALSAIYMLAAGVKVSDIALIKTFQALVILLLDIPISYLSDNRSKRASVLAASVLGSIWLLLMAYADTLGVFYLAEFFNAVSLSLFNGAFIAYLINMEMAETEGAHIQKIIGRYSKYHFIGMGMSAFVGSLFVEVGSQSIWVVSAIIMGLIFIFFYFLLPSEALHEKHETSRLNPIQEVIRILKDIFSNIDRKISILLVIVTAVYYQVIIQLWQLLLNGGNQIVHSKGYFYGAVFVFVLLAQSLAGYVVEKKDKKGTAVLLIFLLILMPLSSLLLDDETLEVVVLIILIFFAVRLVMLLLQADIHSWIPSSLRATYDSVLSTMGRLVLLVVMPAVGCAVEKFGYQNIGIFAVVFIELILLSYILSRRHSVLE